MTRQCAPKFLDLGALIVLTLTNQLKSATIAASRPFHQNERRNPVDKFMHSIGLATHESNPEDGSPVIHELSALPVMDTRTYLRISSHLQNSLDHHRPRITQCTCNGVVYFLFPFPSQETLEAIRPSDESSQVNGYVASLQKMMLETPPECRNHVRLFIKIQQPAS